MHDVWGLEQAFPGEEYHNEQLNYRYLVNMEGTLVIDIAMLL
jgi:hypothetical protein